MSNGPIIDLVAKGLLDEDIMDSSNKTSIFNFNISKKNKYAKGDFRFYPIGKANWGNTFRINIEKKGDLLYGLYVKIKLPIRKLIFMAYCAYRLIYPTYNF